MLPRGRGADAAAAKGVGAVRVLFSAGSQRIRAVEVFCAVRLPPCRASAAPRTGTPTATTFGLFLLPRECPRRFFPAAEVPTAAEADEESMELGFLVVE
jgi:hypothetical protein